MEAQAEAPDPVRFAKVYDRGWQTLRQLADQPMAVKVYSFIAQHCDHLNALVCPVEVMAEEFGVTKRTIMRATKYLEENGHLVILKVGTANAYVLDARDLWKNYDRFKSYCAFDARTLASKKQNDAIKARLSHMMSKKATP